MRFQGGCHRPRHHAVSKHRWRVHMTGKKMVFQKVPENGIVQNWVQKSMRKSLFHLSPLYSRRWIRKKIRHAFWVNKTYYLQSANVDFHISILHIVQFISTYWWIDGFSALLLIHTQTASNPFTFSKDRSLLDNIFNPFVFSYIHISQSCRKNKKFP